MKNHHELKETNFFQQINVSIIERNLLKSSQKILIAVSGGQDSICLLHVLYQLKKKWRWDLGILHCDHVWNWNSKLQSQHVKRLAIDMEIDYYQAIAIQPIPEEGSARNWRYHTLQTIALYHNYTAIITAHTASDRIETLIYNLIRGSGLHGIQALSWRRKVTSGRFIKPPRIKKISITTENPAKKLKKRKTIYGLYKNVTFKNLYLIRPFLDLTRTKIREIVQYLNLPCWPDPTNQNIEISRNRIRTRLIPYIRKNYNHKIEHSLCKWVEIINAENSYLDQLTTSIFFKIKTYKKIKKKNIPGLNIQLFHSFPLALQRRILLKFFKNEIKKTLHFQNIEQIRLFCLLQKSSSLKKQKKNQSRKVIPPYIRMPENKKLQIIKKNLFLF